jgi:hypothetical protein
MGCSRKQRIVRLVALVKLVTADQGEQPSPRSLITHRPLTHRLVHATSQARTIARLKR